MAPAAPRRPPQHIDKGSRATLRLSAHLKRLKGLGLVRRDDNYRDAVVVTDPGGLRTLMAASGGR